MSSPGPNVAVAASTLIVGGAERHLQTLARRLAPRGFRWSFFTVKKAGAVGEELAADGFPLRAGAGAGPVRWLSLFAALSRFDLIVALDHNNVLRALPAAARLLPPYVVLYHRQEEPPPAWRRGLRGAAALVVVARSQRRFVAGAAPGAKIHVIPNGVALPEKDAEARRRVRAFLKIPDDGVVIAAVARLSPEKGIDLLIEGLAALPTARRPYLLVAGDGPQRAALEALAAARLGAGYDFRGEIADVGPVYRAADMFVLPSRQESAPLALLEAMSFGLPVAAAAVGDAPAMVGDAGLTFAPGDAAALAHAVDALAADAAAREQMGARARAAVAAEFTMAKMLDAYEDLFRRAARP